ncbi:MAG: PEGA domain-containing protein [Candidatus Krumholzibacteriota bacterium]
MTLPQADFKSPRGSRRVLEFRSGRRNRKWKAAVLCAAWSLLLFQGSPLPALGQDAADDSPQDFPSKARVVVTSDPSEQRIMLDGQRTGESTPAELELDPGRYHLTVNAEGFQPLSHDLAVSAGELMELEFILLETPPEPPTPEELRALSPPFGADNPDADYWAEAGPRHMANESCRDCHSPILTLHAVGEHRTLACEDCHSALSDHVTDGKVTGVMQVVTGVGIQTLCMTCHDRENLNKKREPARTIVLSRHIQELRVRPVNRCEDCHHVHDPQKWVHEAREMVGLPELIAVIPMMNEKTAYEKKQQYNAMAETFFVFPLAPGILGMAVSEGEGQFPAETFLISGVALILGSYFLGKKAYERELDRIRAINDERRAVNLKVKNHNLLVEKAMVDFEKAVELWAAESEDRGVVVIKGK